MMAPRQRDEGSTLVLTLILTVVMAAIVMAIASYATAGLRTAGVTSDRTLSNIDASNVASWVVEEFAKRTVDPYTTCGESPTYNSVAYPASLVDNGSTITAECARVASSGGHLTVLTYHLIVDSTGERNRSVEVLVDVPTYSYGAWVDDWRVDFDIFAEAPGTTVSPTTTTTVPTTTTTTTTTTVPGLPGTFGKVTPTAGAGGQNRTGLTLRWNPSADADRYEWCLDNTLNNSCDGGVWSSESGTSVTLAGPLGATTNYEWQVRAINEQGTTLADGGFWWEFKTKGGQP
ncbi:MAG: hypothetical protein ACO23O_10350 [Ilumatobacteraceae bacterium]